MPNSFDDPFAFVRSAARPVSPTPNFVAKSKSCYSPLSSLKFSRMPFVAWRKVKVVGVASFAVGALIIGTAIPAAAITQQQQLASVTPVASIKVVDIDEPHVPVMLYQTSSELVAPTVQRDNYIVNYTPPPPLPPSPALFNRSDVFTNNTGGTIQWPFAYGVRLSDGFGPRPSPCPGCSSDHKGQDFDAGTGAPIQSIADGIVTKVEHLSSGLGTYVMIRHQINGETIDSVYGHMIVDSPMVQVGDIVRVGQQIGLVGNTGSSTGAHLHLEIHVDGTPVDPFAWLTANAN